VTTDAEFPGERLDAAGLPEHVHQALLLLLHGVSLGVRERPFPAGRPGL
jgi:hypothetical protein